MNLRISTLAAAVAATFAISGAQAELIQPSAAASGGNGSVVFLAMNVTDGFALTVDLGLQMSAFTNSTDLTSGLTGPITWDFSTNTTNAPVTGTNAWSEAYNQFKTLQESATGSFMWAVVAGDQATGANVSASNVIPGRGFLATGNATEAQMLAASTSGPTGNALGNLANWMAANNNFGSHRTPGVDNGANINTPADGFAWTNDLMKNNFNGNLTWSYLIANGETSTFQWQQQLVANPIVNQFGSPSTIDSLSPAPILFTFDIATNQLTLAPIPEPGTYAMLLAGLAAVGFAARRRKQA
jgi:hypothetical protein